MIEETVILAGLGGIGSHVALYGIARIGCRHLILYDKDVVEPHNLANQAYYTWDLHFKTPYAKVEAVRRYLEHLPEGRIGRITTHQAFADDNPLNYSGIVISAVDSLEARRTIFRGVRYNARVELYIECAAANRIGIVYAFDPRDLDAVEWYEKTLQSKPSGGLTQCVDPDIGPMFGGLVGNILAGHASGRRFRRMRVTECSFKDYKPSMQTYEILPGGEKEK